MPPTTLPPDARPPKIDDKPPPWAPADPGKICLYAEGYGLLDRDLREVGDDLLSNVVENVLQRPRAADNVG
jgi:hypothetical protein